MKPVLAIMAAVVAAIVLAACGGGNSSDATAPADGAKTVSVKQVDGIGNVLVDSTGRALYTPDEEGDGKVRCTSEACMAFRKPLDPGAGAPTAAADAGKLGVIERPDGSRQVTADGKPLYTFSEDSPGEVNGNGFSDDFGSQHFTWHAVLAGGKNAGSSTGDGSAGDSGSGGSGRSYPGY